MKIFSSLVLFTLFCGMSLTSLNAAEEPPAKSPTINDLVSELSRESRRDLMRTLNEADEALLSELPGIESARATIIIQARPLKHITELMLLPGFGEKTVRRIIAQAHLSGSGQDRRSLL